MDNIKKIINDVASNKQNCQYVIGVLICTVILLISYLAYESYNYSKICEQYLDGYWIGDNTFCEESDVSSMLLFIGKKEENKRDLYLIINNDITNQHIKMTSGWKLLCVNKDLNKYTIGGKLEFEEDCGIPDEITFDLNVLDGVLRLYSDGTLYGIFYKDHEVSLLFS
jgi:hypothetical protein